MLPRSSALWFSLALFVCPTLVSAQSITAAPDGTGTVIHQQSGTYQIQGGAIAGQNQFHSFTDFGLSATETAHFLTQPQIQNVLGRVVGGNVSVVNGLIRLSGSTANLYLLNPTGWVLGSGAVLDVPGSFHLSTADRLLFESGEWGNSTSPEDTNWVGNPVGWRFEGAQTGFILNEADLAVSSGQQLSVMAPLVVNAGNLTAPGGNITIAAIPDSSVVRLSQPGQLLSLELNSQAAPDLRTLDLPQHLTGSLTTIQTAGDRLALENITNNLPATSGTAIVSGRLDASSSASEAGDVNLWGQQVALVDANLDASGSTGGNIRIGGDFRGQGNGFNAQRTYINANSNITADGLQGGDAGEIAIWSDQTTQFYGEIHAKGSNSGGDGGFVEVSGFRFLDFRGQVDTTAPAGRAGTLLLDPTDIEIIAGTGNTTDTTLAFADLPATAQISNTVINNATSNVILEATNSITFNAAIAIAANGVGLTASANNGITVNANITTNNGNITLDANADNAGGGELALNNTTLSSGTGAIVLKGTGNTGAANGGNGGTGIQLTNSTLDSSSGNITLTGTGGTGGVGTSQADGGDGGYKNNPGANGLFGGAGGGGVNATDYGGTSGVAGSPGGQGGDGIRFTQSNITSNSGRVVINGQGGDGGTGGGGGGGGGGSRNRNGGSTGVGEGGRSGTSNGLGGAGGDGGGGAACGGGSTGCVGDSGHGGGGFFDHGGGGGGQGGQGGTGGVGSRTANAGTTGASGQVGKSGGGGAADIGTNRNAGGGGGGGAGFSGGGGGVLYRAVAGGNGGVGSGTGGDGGTVGTSGGHGKDGGTGTGTSGIGTQNNNAAHNGEAGTALKGGTGGDQSGNNGGGGGGAGAAGGAGGSGGVGIAFNSGSITTTAGQLSLNGTGGTGGNGGTGGGGGGGGRGTGGGGGGGGGTGGTGGTGGPGSVQNSGFTFANPTINSENINTSATTVTTFNILTTFFEVVDSEVGSEAIALVCQPDTAVSTDESQLGLCPGLWVSKSLHHFALEPIFLPGLTEFSKVVPLLQWQPE